MAELRKLPLPAQAFKIETEMTTGDSYCNCYIF